MARLEKLATPGLWKRGTRFYTRKRMGKRVKWVPLGTDFATARKRMGEIAAGAPVLRKVMIETAVADWLKMYIATRRTPKGQALAAQRAKDHMLAFFEGTTLARLAGDDVRAYRLALEKKGLSQNSVSHLLSDLRCLLSWAVETDRIDKSPFPKRVMPKIAEVAPKGLSDDEVVILTSLPGDLGFYMRLALGTGCRWGELCRAQAHHIKEGTLTLSKTKGGKVRRVPLGTALLDECRSRVGKLFPYSENSTGTFNRMIRRNTGIKGFHVHQCRHTFAMRWIAGGGSLAALQSILGHQSIETTMRYARVTDALVEREAKRVRDARQA